MTAVYVNNSHKFGKPLNIIYPGEYYVTGEDEFIGTLLGSCVAVCLFDPEKKIGGMNHYMLPGRISEADVFNDENARYGIAAITTLLSEIIRAGASRDNLKSKIFGGGNIIKFLDINGKSSLIPSDNVRLAKLFMEIEDIPILAFDTGFDYTRKLIFDVWSGRVFMRKIRKDNVNSIVSLRDEDVLIQNIQESMK